MQFSGKGVGSYDCRWADGEISVMGKGLTCALGIKSTWRAKSHPSKALSVTVEINFRKKR